MELPALENIVNAIKSAGIKASVWQKYGRTRIYVGGRACGYYEVHEGWISPKLKGYDDRIATAINSVLDEEYLTPERFEKACDGAIKASRVDTDMMVLAKHINREEASALVRLPKDYWYISPTIKSVAEIVSVEIPQPTSLSDEPKPFRDSDVLAVLSVACQYGVDEPFCVIPQ